MTFCKYEIFHTYKQFSSEKTKAIIFWKFVFRAIDYCSLLSKVWNKSKKTVKNCCREPSNTARSVRDFAHCFFVLMPTICSTILLKFDPLSIHSRKIQEKSAWKCATSKLGDEVLGIDITSITVHKRYLMNSFHVLAKTDFAYPRLCISHVDWKSTSFQIDN